MAGSAVDRIDLRSHAGIHPRLGAVDVVPFVPLGAGPPATARRGHEALAARDRFAGWAGSTLDLPCFLYGPERTLPEVRRSAFRSLAPDTGPRPHPTAGATAVGSPPVLVAYNVWIAGEPGCDRTSPSALSVARALAAELRGPSVRSPGSAAVRPEPRSAAI